MRNNHSKNHSGFLLRILLLLTFLAGIFFLPGKQSWAGDINDEEARVIAVASGTFTYEGKVYVAYSSYVDQLYNYLARDDINLTAAQATKAIRYIKRNVKRGISEGYIYVIGDAEPTETTASEADTDEPLTETTETSETGDTAEGSTDSTETASTENTATEDSTGTESGKPRTTESSTINTIIDDDDLTEEGTSEETTEAATEDEDIEYMFRSIEGDRSNRDKLNERVDPDEASASAIINEESIVIDIGDGDTIELDSSREIIPSVWPTGLIITAAVTAGIAMIACLILILKKCMRFRKTDRRKPLPGHRRRRKIRKFCRRILMVTTGISIAGIFLLIALFAALFSPGQLEKNIQDSGYFRYAYIEYLSEHGRALEGAEYLSDEEAAIVAEKVKEAEKTTEGSEPLLTYEQFMIREKQSTQELLSGNRDVVYQHSNVAPYLLRIKEDLEFSMYLSGGLFLLALLLGCVFTIFMDLRRDRGIRMIAISSLAGTVCSAALALFLFFWAPAKRLFIEPDYLYLFFRNYMDWIVKICAVVTVFGLVLGMSLIGIYISRRKGRSN